MKKVGRHWSRDSTPQIRYFVLNRMNRAAQRVCEGDVKDKHHCQGLDDRMYQLRNSSSRIGFYPGVENVDNT